MVLSFVSSGAGDLLQDEGAFLLYSALLLLADSFNAHSAPLLQQGRLLQPQVLIGCAASASPRFCDAHRWTSSPWTALPGTLESRFPASSIDAALEGLLCHLVSHAYFLSSEVQITVLEAVVVLYIHSSSLLSLSLFFLVRKFGHELTSVANLPLFFSLCWAKICATLPPYCMWDGTTAWLDECCVCP